jgi:hypothetical protein
MICILGDKAVQQGVEGGDGKTNKCWEYSCRCWYNLSKAWFEGKPTAIRTARRIEIFSEVSFPPFLKMPLGLIEIKRTRRDCRHSERMCQSERNQEAP